VIKTIKKQKKNFFFILKTSALSAKNHLNSTYTRVSFLGSFFFFFFFFFYILEWTAAERLGLFSGQPSDEFLRSDDEVSLALAYLIFMLRSRVTLYITSRIPLSDLGT
jgi:hypothetical protein